MAFTAAEVEEFIAAVQADPLLRDRVRNAILAEDFLALPGIVARLGDRIEALVEQDARVEQRLAELATRMGEHDQRMAEHDRRMDQLTERMDRLAERMDQLTERMDRLAERMDQLTERMDRLAERMDQLTERMDRLAERMDQLTRQVTALVGRVGNLEGRVYEMDYKLNAAQHHFVGVRILAPGNYPALVAAWSDGRLSDEDWDDLNLVDAVALARRGKQVDAEEVMLALELSLTVDANDVARADRRAEILRRAGFPGLACVDGETIERSAKTLAGRIGVLALVQKEAAAG